MFRDQDFIKMLDIYARLLCWPPNLTTVISTSTKDHKHVYIIYICVCNRCIHIFDMFGLSKITALEDPQELDRNVAVQSEASASSSMVTLNGEVTIPQQRPCHNLGLGRRLSSEKWALRIFSEYMLLGGIVTSIFIRILYPYIMYIIYII